MSPKSRPAPLVAGFTALAARVRGLKAVRVVGQYVERRGPLLAAGLSYRAIFAVFAGLWVAFSIAGLVIQSTPSLRDAVFDIIAASAPGLIDGGDGTGAIPREKLLEAGVLSWTGSLALVGLLVTALSWLAAGRAAVRTIFDLGNEKTNLVLQRLKDLGLAVAFGAALLVSAALSVVSTAATGAAFDLLGIDDRSGAAIVVGRAIGLAIVLALDTVVLGLFYRFVADIRIPVHTLVGGALLGGIALGILKALGGSLLGAAGSNPLLASFAVIVGLLVWFNLVCQVILIAASWIAVSVTDDSRKAADRRPIRIIRRRKPRVGATG